MQVDTRTFAALAAIALVAIAGSLPGCGGADARRASHLARGQQYLAGGKLEKARVEFANALQIAPQDAQARYLMGKVVERLGDLRGAAAMYQGAIDADPGQLEARAGLARLYVLAGQAEKALSLIEPVLARQPDNEGLLVVRALARARLDDLAGALADAGRAAQLSPSDPEAMSALAAIHAARGEDRLAETQLLRLVQIRPKELAPRLQLAAFYTRGRHLDEAEHTLRAAMTELPGSREAKLAYAEFLAGRSAARGEEAYRELIAREPRDYDLQLALGALEQKAGETAQAVATYRSVIAQDPKGPKGVAARDRIAALDVLAGRYADARPLLAEALASSPHDDDALVLRANLALRDGDAVGAIADLRAVLRDQPGAVPILRSLARAHLANRSPVLAEENLRTALAAAPNDVDVQVDLGELLTRTQRAAQAATLLEATVQANPAATAARTALIEAYLATDDLAAARGAAEQLKAARPDLPAGSYLAGLIAERQHRPEDAQRELEHALALQPSAPEALEALARLEMQRGRGAQALTLVRGAIDRSPADATPHELLGELYITQRSYPEAIAALRDAVRLAPHWALPYRNLALAELGRKDTGGALAAYEAGVTASGEPALVVDLAEAYVQQGRVDDAARQYEGLLRRSPNLEVAANNLAMLLVTYRHDQQSLDRARDLTTAFASSDVAALLDTYGWVRLKRGEVPEALMTLARASQLAPASKVILYHLGMAYLKAGQSDKARTSLAAALEGGAAFTGTQEARLALAQLADRG